MSGELIKDTCDLSSIQKDSIEFVNDMNYVSELLCPLKASDIRENVIYKEVIHFEYESKSVGCMRAANILLPANYDADKKYPVLYFMHGIFGDEYSMVGDANNKIPQIVSNLAADGVIDNVIVVFPNMYATSDKNLKPGFDAKQIAPYDFFINDLVNDLVPYIESEYSVSDNRQDRGIIGFSMGGRETLYIGLNCSDLFAYIGAIAPAPGLTPSKDWAMEHKGQLAEENLRFSDDKCLPSLLMICCGTKDSVVGEFPKTYHEIMNRNKVEHLWYEVPDADHDSNAIKSGLYNFLIRWRKYKG